MLGNDDTKSVQILAHQLCKKFAGNSEEALNTLLKSSLVTLSSNISPLANNEVELVEKIKRKLAQNKSNKEAADFSELYRKLQSHQILRSRWQILYFLYQLSQLDKSKTSKRVYEFVSSTPMYHNEIAPSSSIRTLKDVHTGGGFMLDNVSSIYDTSSVLSRIKASTFPDFGASGDKKSSNLTSLQTISSLKVDPSTKGSANLSNVSSKFTQGYPESIVRDVIYVLQGIDGKCVIYDKDREMYKIISEVEISMSASKMVGRLCECGFLHNKIRQYLEVKADQNTQGVVRQSLCSALHEELIEYYRLIANMEAHVHQEESLRISEHSITLRRMLVWLNDPFHRLRVLASLVHACQDKKGGELVSAVHSFMKHGDPNLQSLTNKILSMVSHPIFNFVWRWIYDGELEDPFEEFFVAPNPLVKDDEVWRDRYILREAMIPSFVTQDQARKILLAGKTISFLRRVCSDRTLIKDREVVKAADTIETMLSQGRDAIFTKRIDVVYKETSSYLLKVLYERYKFMDHLKAMRKYLLLGQGDFIRHLMDLLEEDLAKPAQTIFLHNLSGILESAIRATNVQYDDPDIVRRLDVQRLEVSPGDTGWMVFSLEYHISGHIRTVFTPETMSTYLKVSNFLWRAKRMEYILSVVWREQITRSRILRPYSEFAPILHTSHLIGSEMLHFVQQIQYYINFEVLECSWVELMSKVEEADDLDQVIFAHHEFLNAITSRSLLDPELKAIVTKLKEIFDLVIKFQETQEIIHSKLMHEVEARKHFRDEKRSREVRGEWATDNKLEEREKRRKDEFTENLAAVTLPDLKFLGRNYKKKVEEFLSLVSKLSDVSLRCLIFRLNFNEHYRHLQPHSSRTSSIAIPSTVQT